MRRKILSKSAKLTNKAIKDNPNHLYLIMENPKNIESFSSNHRSATNKYIKDIKNVMHVYNTLYDSSVGLTAAAKSNITAILVLVESNVDILVNEMNELIERANNAKKTKKKPKRKTLRSTKNRR